MFFFTGMSILRCRDDKPWQTVGTRLKRPFARPLFIRREVSDALDELAVADATQAELGNQRFSVRPGSAEIAGLLFAQDHFTPGAMVSRVHPEDMSTIQKGRRAANASGRLPWTMVVA